MYLNNAYIAARKCTTVCLAYRTPWVYIDSLKHPQDNTKKKKNWA